LGEKKKTTETFSGGVFYFYGEGVPRKTKGPNASMKKEMNKQSRKRGQTQAEKTLKGDPTAKGEFKPPPRGDLNEKQ